MDHRRKPIGWEEAGVVHRVSPFPFSIRLQAPTVALRETLSATFKFPLHNASRVPVLQTRPEPIACRGKPRSSSLQIRAIHQPSKRMALPWPLRSAAKSPAITDVAVEASVSPVDDDGIHWASPRTQSSTPMRHSFRLTNPSNFTMRKGTLNFIIFRSMYLHFSNDNRGKAWWPVTSLSNVGQQIDSFEDFPWEFVLNANWYALRWSGLSFRSNNKLSDMKRFKKRSERSSTCAFNFFTNEVTRLHAETYSAFHWIHEIKLLVSITVKQDSVSLFNP